MTLQHLTCVTPRTVLSGLVSLAVPPSGMLSLQVLHGKHPPAISSGLCSKGADSQYPPLDSVTLCTQGSALVVFMAASTI